VSDAHLLMSGDFARVEDANAQPRRLDAAHGPYAGGPDHAHHSLALSDLQTWSVSALKSAVCQPHTVLPELFEAQLRHIHRRHSQQVSAAAN
jgi:hypothetical protein